MFNGKNESGLEFEVVDEDGAVLGAFGFHAEAVSCANSQPWWTGRCNIRREPRPVLRDTAPKWWMYEPA